MLEMVVLSVSVPPPPLSPTHQAEQEQTALQSQLDEIRNLQPHAVKLAQLQQDLKELDRRVNTETSKLGGETVRSATVVNRELKKIQTDS